MRTCQCAATTSCLVPRRSHPAVASLPSLHTGQRARELEHVTYALYYLSLQIINTLNHFTRVLSLIVARLSSVMISKKCSGSSKKKWRMEDRREGEHAVCHPHQRAARGRPPKHRPGKSGQKTPSTSSPRSRLCSHTISKLT